MAIEHTVDLEWIGGFIDGEGKVVNSTSGKLNDFEVSWQARTDGDTGLTTPEELLAGALASCFAMQLSSGLVGGGWEPMETQISCTIGFEVGIGITSAKLTARVEVDGEIPDEKLVEVAERAKLMCPVSKALAGIEITLDLPDVELPEEEEEEEGEGDEEEVGAAAEE